MASSTTTTTTSTTTSQGDARATDRGGTQLQTGTGAAGGVATHAPSQHGSSGGKLVHGVEMDPDQIKTATTGLATEARKTAMTLSQSVPGEFQSNMKLQGTKPEVPNFIVGMATLQLNNVDRFGHMPTDPNKLIKSVNVAKTADDAVTAVESPVVILNNISRFNLRVSYRDALRIYRRGLALAETNPDIKEAIAPFREMYLRIAKKAAHTRKKKKAAAQPPATVPDTGTATPTKP